jgi:hypothetical protein
MIPGMLTYSLSGVAFTTGQLLQMQAGKALRGSCSLRAGHRVHPAVHAPGLVGEVIFAATRAVKPAVT